MNCALVSDACKMLFLGIEIEKKSVNFTKFCVRA